MQRHSTHQFDDERIMARHLACPEDLLQFLHDIPGGGNIMVKPIPEGYRSVTPYLIVTGASAAIDFYKKAFGATEDMRMEGTEGKIGHAELTIGNSKVMLADEYPEMGYRSPRSLGGAGVSLMLYIDKVDDVFKRAIAAGAKELQPIKDQFYGDRSGTLQDPFGHVWTVSMHVEDVEPEEMRRRAEQYMKQQAKG